VKETQTETRSLGSVWSPAEIIQLLINRLAEKYRLTKIELQGPEKDNAIFYFEREIPDPPESPQWDPEATRPSEENTIGTPLCRATSKEDIALAIARHPRMDDDIKLRAITRILISPPESAGAIASSYWRLYDGSEKPSPPTIESEATSRFPFGEVVSDDEPPAPPATPRPLSGHNVGEDSRDI
jgi:hypothetical protein